jgi:hypothetical protein
MNKTREPWPGEPGRLARVRRNRRICAVLVGMSGPVFASWAVAGHATALLVAVNVAVTAAVAVPAAVYLYLTRPRRFR